MLGAIDGVEQELRMESFIFAAALRRPTARRSACTPVRSPFAYTAFVVSGIAAKSFRTPLSAFPYLVFSHAHDFSDS